MTMHFSCSEIGLDRKFVYITFENSLLSSIINKYFQDTLCESGNTLEHGSVAVNEGEFGYRGSDSIAAVHFDDFFLEPQKAKSGKYSEWELPFGPKTLLLFSPLLARIIENNFTDQGGKTAALVKELVERRAEIAEQFVSFTWVHTEEGETTDDNGEFCDEQVITKFVYKGDKIKRTRKRERCY